MDESYKKSENWRIWLQHMYENCNLLWDKLSIDIFNIATVAEYCISNYYAFF